MRDYCTHILFSNCTPPFTQTSSRAPLQWHCAPPWPHTLGTTGLRSSCRMEPIFIFKINTICVTFDLFATFNYFAFIGENKEKPGMNSKQCLLNRLCGWGAKKMSVVILICHHLTAHIPRLRAHTRQTAAPHKQASGHNKNTTHSTKCVWTDALQSINRDELDIHPETRLDPWRGTCSCYCLWFEAKMKNKTSTEFLQNHSFVSFEITIKQRHSLQFFP